MPKLLLILIAASILVVPLRSIAQSFDAVSIFEKCSPAVVKIHTPHGTGAGFIINENGYLVTNYHVIANPDGGVYSQNDITIELKNGFKYNAAFIDPLVDYQGFDIAIVRINTYMRNYIPLIDKQLKVGTEVVTIGHPLGDDWNQSKGVISRLIPNQHLIQHDIATDPGNSGGPILNAKGQVVGVVVYGIALPVEGYTISLQRTGNYAADVSLLKHILDKRGIKYSTNPIVTEGVSISEMQMQQLKIEQERIASENERLRKSWAALESERTKFYQERAIFQKKVTESQALIDRGEQIKKELDRIRKSNENRSNELDNREIAIERKEVWIRQKELDIKKKLTERMALEFMLSPNYNYVNDQFNHYVTSRASAGLFYRFGFERDWYNDVINSDKIGLVYSIQKVYSIEYDDFIRGYNHDISVAAEFNELIRLGVGKSLKNEYGFWGYNDYNLLYLKINTTGLPVAFGFSLSYYTDNSFTFSNYSIGAYVAFSLTFLRY